MPLRLHSGPAEMAKAMASQQLLRRSAIAVVTLMAMLLAPGSSALELPASPHIVDLDSNLFETAVTDGRVYFVEFYTTSCRACKRVVHQVNELADRLADAGQSDIVIARVECERQEALCIGRGVENTPTFKVYYKGRHEITYNPSIFHVDMAQPFIQKYASKLVSGSSSTSGTSSSNEL